VYTYDTVTHLQNAGAADVVLNGAAQPLQSRPLLDIPTYALTIMQAMIGDKRCILKYMLAARNVLQLHTCSTQGLLM
jgi:hypothetical protein